MMDSGNVLLISAIADIVTIIMAMAGMIAVMMKRATNDGRMTEILSNLQSDNQDHETRIRVLEAKIK